MPAGIEEGQTLDLREQTFELRIREPVEFPLYYSGTRLTDAVGAIVPVDPLQMTALPPIRTVLQTAKKGAAETVRVALQAKLTEIGTLELGCVRADAEPGTNATWRLQFDVRAAVQTEREGHVGAAEQEGFVDAAARRGVSRADPQGVRRERSGKSSRVADQAGRRSGRAARGVGPPRCFANCGTSCSTPPRGDASPRNTRRDGCGSPGLRCGRASGLAVDDWRTAQMWRLLTGKRYFNGVRVRVEGQILWRRIARAG